MNSKLILCGALGLLILQGLSVRSSVRFDSPSEASYPPPQHIEAMSLSLYDADRFHYLLKAYCKEQGYQIRYHGVLSESEHHAGIQLELPVGASMWTVSFVDRKTRTSEVKWLPEVGCELVARSRVGNRTAWNLKLFEADLAILLNGKDPEIGRATQIGKDKTIDTFFSGFCRFAENQMSDAHYGVPFLPKDEPAK